MTPTAYRLRQPVTARRPTRWDIQMRYAMRLPDKTVDLSAGTWLLTLPEAEGGRPGPPHYRLADGAIVCLDASLTAAQAEPLTDPQAITALALVVQSRWASLRPGHERSGQRLRHRLPGTGPAR